MATLNGSDLQLTGLTLAQIGRELLKGSPQGDGKGIILELSQTEERTFEEFAGLFVGRAICELLADAIKERGGDPAGLPYRYQNQTFTT